MNAVIYARFSCENQREESIEGQVRECRVFAERKGYSVIKTYADRALSGTRADNRPEFQQMISDSESGSFELIIVWKIDRFSRDKYDSTSAKTPMETMTKGRVYVTVNSQSTLKSVTYYDKNNKRFKQLDLDHSHNIKGDFEQPHTHKGYFHNEKGDFNLSPKEQKMIDRVQKVWYYYNNGK